MSRDESETERRTQVGRCGITQGYQNTSGSFQHQGLVLSLREEEERERMNEYKSTRKKEKEKRTFNTQKVRVGRHWEKMGK